MIDEKKNIILEKAIEFSIMIINYTEILQEQKKFVIANQLMRSGTSVGANMHEAQNAESKADFIHKFKIAAKEIEETFYWLTLCKKAANYPDCDFLIEPLIEIKKITNKIIATSKNKN